MLITSAWQEDHVALHVASGLVVLAVADFPGEVWDKESRVAKPTNGVVQGLALRERLVSTLVGKHPQTGSKETLEEGVHSPESSSECV